MTNLPTVKFANSDVSITRLVSGGNPMCGYSHFSDAMDAEMTEYFTEDVAVGFLHSLQAAGINTLLARGDYHRILHYLELFRRQGGELHWIAQSASEMHDIFQNIRILAAAGTIGIYHHGSRTDRYWLEGDIDKVNDYLKCMRDCGVQVGLASHFPEVIEYAEEKDWDIDFYLTCFYNLNRKARESKLESGNPSSVPLEIFEPNDPARMCETIRRTDKMCLAFKILAAARLCSTQDDVRAAFEFALDNIKAKDAVVVGMFPKHTDQIHFNIAHTLAACERKQSI